MGMQLHPAPTRIRRALGALTAVGALLALSACGDDEQSNTSSAATTPEATTVAGAVAFNGQWARTSPMMATLGAVYVTITSPVDDMLIGGSVDAAVAGALEIHETFVMGSDTTAMGGGEMGSDTTAMGGGEMGMRPVDSIALPAGTAVELKPGGYHIMLIDLVAPLEVGDTIKVTLTFEQAGEITIDVPVLDEAP
jgi:periplasmic copper chaperone A